MYDTHLTLAPRPAGAVELPGMPARLLALLTDQPQTGDQLGERLGVNRVTVNTLARKLQDQGLPVLTSRHGYALAPGTPAPPLVQPALPPGTAFGRAMRYQGAVGSTQDEIRAWADDPHAPAPHGAVVVAERQTAGRGRRGRPWSTARGTLVFSVLLSGEEGSGLTLPDLALMPLAAGVALHAAAALPAGVGLKWPNDLLTRAGLPRRKVAGVLLEAELRGEEARRAVLGIGVNVTAAPEGAAHLAEFRPTLTRAAFLAALLGELEHWLAQPAPAVLDAWRQASLTLGQAVQVQTPRGLVSGTASDLDAQGNLLVTGEDGQIHTVSAGDVQLVGEL